MSIRGIKNIGIPTVLLHEGEGLTLTVETRAGYSYRGVCATTEDNMNISLKDVTATDQHGAVSKLERVFIRGSQVLLVVFPNVFTRAPFFTRVALASQGVSFAGGLGRGRQAAMGVRAAKDMSRGGAGGGPPHPPFQGPPGHHHGPHGPFPGGPPPPGYGPPPGFGGGPPPFGGPPGGFGGPPPHFGGGGPPRPFEDGAGRGSDRTRPAWQR